MFKDGFLNRLSGLLREYREDFDQHPADKLILVTNYLQRVGGSDDMKAFVTDFCDAFANVPQGNQADENTILYSSSLMPGRYVMLPYYHNGLDRVITCNCVHCSSPKLSTAMHVALTEDSLAVTASCEDCLKVTEVYYLGIGKTLELPEPSVEQLPDTVDIQGGEA